MSCPGDNWLVPSANPNNVQGGVQSITAATPNVTIGGTPSVPSIGVTTTGGVTQLEGIIGNINLNGVGMSIVGATPTAQDITLTSAVQNIVAGTNCSVTNNAGTFTINRTGGTGGGTFTTVVLPVVNVGSTSHPGGGTPNNYGVITLPTVDPTKNTFVQFTLTIAGTGSQNAPAFYGNDLSVGILRGNTQQGTQIVYNSGLVTPVPSINWGSYPATNNFVTRVNVPISEYLLGNYNYCMFVSYPLNANPYYTFNGLQFQLTVTYLT